MDAKTRARMQNRVDLLMDANRRVSDGKGSALFLFTDLPSLLVADDILAMPWTNGKGETVRLTDQPREVRVRARRAMARAARFSP